MANNNDVIELLDILYGMVTEAWGVPLGNDKCIIEREKADAWDEGFRAGDDYGTSYTETHAGYRDSLPIRPANPYRGEGE